MRIDWAYEPIPKYELYVNDYLMGHIVRNKAEGGCWDNDWSGESWRAVHWESGCCGTRGTMERAKDLLLSVIDGNHQGKLLRLVPSLAAPATASLSLSPESNPPEGQL